MKIGLIAAYGKTGRHILNEAKMRNHNVTAIVLNKANLRTNDVDALEKDLFHEPFRAKLIPQFTEIHKAAKTAGAYGTALSGAGPTMISLVPQAICEQFVIQMKAQFPTHKIILTTADSVGVNAKVIA